MDEQSKCKHLGSGADLLDGIYYVALCCRVGLPSPYTLTTEIASCVPETAPLSLNQRFNSHRIWYPLNRLVCHVVSSVVGRYVVSSRDRTCFCLMLAATF
jgi:hypothetical protein